MWSWHLTVLATIPTLSAALVMGPPAMSAVEAAPRQAIRSLTHVLEEDGVSVRQPDHRAQWPSDLRRELRHG